MNLAIKDITVDDVRVIQAFQSAYEALALYDGIRIKGVFGGSIVEDLGSGNSRTVTIEFTAQKTFIRVPLSRNAVGYNSIIMPPLSPAEVWVAGSLVPPNGECHLVCQYPLRSWISDPSYEGYIGGGLPDPAINGFVALESDDAVSEQVVGEEVLLISGEETSEDILSITRFPPPNMQVDPFGPADERRTSNVLACVVSVPDDVGFGFSFNIPITGSRDMRGLYTESDTTNPWLIANPAGPYSGVLTINYEFELFSLPSHNFADKFNSQNIPLT